MDDINYGYRKTKPHNLVRLKLNSIKNHLLNVNFYSIFEPYFKVNDKFIKYFEYEYNNDIYIVEIKDKSIYMFEIIDLNKRIKKPIYKSSPYIFKNNIVEYEFKYMIYNDKYEENYDLAIAASINHIKNDYLEDIQKINLIEKDLIKLLKNKPLLIRINLEELAKEAFKPSRVNYILSLNPDYEFDQT